MKDELTYIKISVWFFLKNELCGKRCSNLMASMQFSLRVIDPLLESTREKRGGELGSLWYIFLLKTKFVSISTSLKKV
jgi:hypothetical protein